MKADRLRRFLAAYKKMSFSEYLETTTGHTGAAGLSRRLSWALEHGDDPEHRDEAEFLLRWEQELRVIAADEPAVPDAWTAVEAEELDVGVHSRSPDVLDDEFETVSLDELGEAARRLPSEPERTLMTEDSDKAAQSAKRRRKRTQAKTLTPMDADEIAAALSSLGESPGADIGAPALREVFRPPAARAPGAPEGETASGMATPSFAPRRDRSTLPPTKAAAPSSASGFLNIIDLPDDDEEDDLEQPTVHAPVGFYDGVSDGDPSSEDGLEPATELLGHSHAAAMAAALEAPTELPTNDEPMDAAAMDLAWSSEPEPVAAPVPVPVAAPAERGSSGAAEQPVPRVDLPPPTAEIDLPKAHKPASAGISTPVLGVVMLAVAALVVAVALWALGDGVGAPSAAPVGVGAPASVTVAPAASAPPSGLEVLFEPPAPPAPDAGLVPLVAPEPAIEPAPVVPPAAAAPAPVVPPPAPPVAVPAPVAAAAPAPVADPAPVAVVEPAPAADPAPAAVVEPAPAAVVEPAPAAVVEPAPAAVVEPAPAVAPAPPTE